MEHFRQKSPQELAAQAMDSYPYFSSLELSQSEAERLSKGADTIKGEIKKSNPYTLQDSDLAAMLDEYRLEATRKGIWNPLSGDNSEANIASATERYIKYGYSEAEAEKQAKEVMAKFGYTDAVRRQRKGYERAFLDPVEKFLKTDSVDSSESENQPNEDIIEIGRLAPEQVQKIGTDFPGGNFLFHGSKTAQIIQILGSGFLGSHKALQEHDEEQSGKPSDRPHNSGYEGISWSFNAVDSLPGDRYHLAGFVASPEFLLSHDEQLTIPSRPAAHEVIQISRGIDPTEYYQAKTQFELLRDFSPMGESNSVLGNILAMQLWENEEFRSMMDQPILLKNAEFLSDPESATKLRELFSIDDDGNIQLSPSLLQQPTEGRIPVAAVWIQALIDSGRIELLPSFREKKTVSEVVSAIDSTNYREIIKQINIDTTTSEGALRRGDQEARAVKIPIEQMYLVVPKKDIKIWLKVLAKVEHKPMGIIAYDGQTVRLENFASSHRGDNDELTEQLQSIIQPKEGYIDYSEVLGVMFEDNMRRGHRRQVIGEEFLSKRRAIKKADTGLEIA